MLIGNIFEAETIVEGEIIQSSRYVSCVHSVIISGFSIASIQIFFSLGGHVQDHLQTQSFFVGTRTAMRREILHLQQQIPLPRTALH
jgi:hypothetical protein